ncbi:hypothetical protein [uncultured Algibacter sp.]|uniref:hypothetical protein n=1 Tax=uncultured Algibacter sp. TaxID=298659 RepID=UPI0030EBFD2A|tara:strand:- start:718 stop:897 length:180 start_codon:yes stop_codon:yes gene_type:complete
MKRISYYGIYRTDLGGWYRVRDSRGKPTGRHDRGLVTDSPTFCDPARRSAKLGLVSKTL